MPHLYMAPEPEGQEPTEFQGKAVSASKVRVGRLEFEMAEEFNVDDIVKVTVELRVGGVAFDVNERSGDLERRHTMRLVDVLEVSKVTSPGWSS